MLGGIIIFAEIHTIPMKAKHLLLVCLSVIIISCGQQSSDSVGNEKIVKTLYGKFNEHKWSEMAALYSDPAEFKDPAFGTNAVSQTREQITQKYSEMEQMFPDIHDKVINIYPSGTKHVIVEFVSTGTAPDSSRFELPICTIFTIENGLITKDFTYYDNFENPDVSSDSTASK